MSNFTLRFAYMFFFEVCLCALINSSNSQRDSGFLLTLSVLVLLAILALLLFLGSLFWRGGPYMVPKSYEDRSIRRSFWWYRPLRPGATDCLCKVPTPPAHASKVADGEVESAAVNANANDDDEAGTDRQLL